MANLNARAWSSLFILALVMSAVLFASAPLYLAGTPLALASWWGYLALACFMPFLIARLYDEEKLLAQELPGYTDYMKRVRYRLIPYIW